MKILVFTLVLLIICVQAQEESHEVIELDKPYTFTHSIDNFFSGTYTFKINESNIPEGGKWYFFVLVEPEEIQEWLTTSIELKVGTKAKEKDALTVKRCDGKGVDSCFLTNKNFNYKTEQVHATIRCRGNCTFKISAEISEPYKLKIGEKIRLDFEQTAYSKIFTLNTSSETFDQLRIILKPEGFLRFSAPISLYVNKGQKIPTREHHDFNSLTLWDNGQGIFLDQPEASGLFTILIEGPEKNILTLENQLITSKQLISLTINEPYFDYLAGQGYKNYKVKVDQTKGNCFKISTLSGAVKLEGIYDEDMNAITDEFAELTRSFSEIQYQLAPQFFAKNKDKFKINEFMSYQLEGVKESTFVLEYFYCNNNISHLLPEVNRYVELQAQETSQYYVEIVQLDTSDFKASKFQISIFSQEESKVNVRFFACEEEHGANCELSRQQLESKKGSFRGGSIREINKYSVVNELEGVKLYNFNIPSKDFKKLGNESKRYILSMLITSHSENETLYMVQYINYGHTRYLIQGELLTDHIGIDEEKYYKFTNLNADVKQIRVHLVEVSGRVVMAGYLNDPRNTDQEGKEIYQYRNALRISDVKQNQTIYLKISGKESAYYSLSLQLIKESEFDWMSIFRNRTTNDHRGYNEIIIQEEVPYIFTLKPNETQVYQVHSTKKQFTLTTSSSLPLDLCMTEDIKRPPKQPNCQIAEVREKKKVQHITMQNGLQGNIAATNNNDRDVKFQIQFTVKDREEAFCAPSLLGKTIERIIVEKKKYCFTYNILKAEDLEVVVELLNANYSGKIDISLNSKEKINMIGSIHMLSKEEIESVCKFKTSSSPQCNLKIEIHSIANTTAYLIVQHLTGQIYLLDGIANSFHGTETGSRKFIYHLNNKINTTIVLENKKGFYKFYGKIVDRVSYEQNNAVVPSSTDKDFESSNPFYYSYQVYVLTEQTLKKSQCSDCLLIISVVKDKNYQGVNQKGKYNIQITQEDSTLKENRPVVGYLQKKSYAFYEFNNQEKGIILVSINSQHKKCADIFMRKGSDKRASGSDYTVKSEGNNLLLTGSDVGPYSIMLEATENCQYAIEISTSKSNFISKLERGVFSDVQLKAGSSTTFIYQNIENATIRILSMHQSGEFILQAKAFPDLKALLEVNGEDVKYDWKGKDYLRIEKDEKLFCYDCVYLIQVQTTRQTKGSVLIPVEGADFPITMDSMIKEQLKRNETETYRIYTSSIAQFEVNVFFGKVNMTIYSSSDDKIQYTKVFEKTKFPEYRNFTHTNSSSEYEFMRYSRVIFTALDNTLYSFSLISDKSEQKRGDRVKPGTPEYVSLDQNKRTCLKGVLDYQKEKFLLSFAGDDNLLSKVKYDITSQKKKLNLLKSEGKNEIILTNNDTLNYPAEYEFCIESAQTLYITFVQSGPVIYFHEKSVMVVNKQQNFTYYAYGKSVVELNQCKSRVILTISNTFKDLGQMSSQIRQIRKSNNIIEFTSYGLVYLHALAESAVISWRNKNEQESIGIGYDQYAPGALRVLNDADTIKVVVFPLRKLIEDKFLTNQIKKLSIQAYAADQEKNLNSVMNCNEGAGVSISMVVTQGFFNGSFNMTFQKTDLQPFEKKSYFLVGVKVEAIFINKKGDEESYRFFYGYQQASIASKERVVDEININPINPQPQINPEKGDNSVMTYLTILLAAAIVIFCIYRNFIRKCMRRRRTGLAEEGSGSMKYQEFATLS